MQSIANAQANELVALNELINKRLVPDPKVGVNGGGRIVPRGGAGMSPSITAPMAIPATADPIIVEFFWWGFHFVIPESAMNEIASAERAGAAFLALCAAALGTAAAPFLPVAAAYVLAEITFMLAVDRGNGVYLSMAWVAPAVFVPTTR